jgi:hypothetical protein
MSKKYILALPEAQAIIDIVNDKGQLKRIVREIISALQGVHLALEAISAGEKLFEVWELRRKLNELKHPENAMNDATFIVLTTEERDFILAGTKRFDWTIGGKVNFWIRWEPFFTALANIKEFDEKNPPVEYVEWKRKWDADIAEINAKKLAAEEAALAKKNARDAFRTSSYDAALASELEKELQSLKELGKLGNAATTDDLPEASRTKCISAANFAADSAVAAYDVTEAANAKEAAANAAAVVAPNAAPAVVKVEDLSNEATPVSQEIVSASDVA